MSTTVTIQERTGDTMLCLYPRQDHPQPCYLELNLRTGHLSADYSGEIGNAVSIEVWNGVIRRYPIPILRNDSANALMHKIAPLAQQVIEDSEIRWNGHDHVGVLGAAAERAEQIIKRIIAPYDDDLYWEHAADWLADNRQDLIERINAGATVDELIDELDGDGTAEDHPVLVHLRRYLDYLAGNY
jgi:hypothetical protein